MWDSSILCKVLLEWKNENFHSDGSFLEWNMISFKQKLFFCGTEQSEGIIGLDHERKEKRFMGINWKNKIRKIIAEGGVSRCSASFGRAAADRTGTSSDRTECGEPGGGGTA